MHALKIGTEIVLCSSVVLLLLAALMVLVYGLAARYPKAKAEECIRSMPFGSKEFKESLIQDVNDIRNARTRKV